MLTYFPSTIEANAANAAMNINRTKNKAQRETKYFCPKFGLQTADNENEI